MESLLSVLMTSDSVIHSVMKMVVDIIAPKFHVIFWMLIRNG